MRVTTVFRRLLAVTQLFVEGVRFESAGLVLTVRPRWRSPRCGGCGRRFAGYDRRPARRWRHLGYGDFSWYLEYAPRRVACPDCGIRVEQVPWAAARSRFTLDFEELVAYLAQVTDKTQVTKPTGISWSTVGAIVERVVGRQLDRDRLKGLRRIGIDEFSYRSRHRYVTVVVDHDRHRVVWAGEGNTAETLGIFFDALGPDGLSELESITIDMAPGYRKAIEERAPHVRVVFDRFHVQRLATDALDKVRREQLREVRGTPQGREIYRSRFALLKNPWNLSRSESQKLKDIQRTNAPLYRAYLLKESLAQALDYKQPRRAERALREWLAWACRSKLRPFVRVSRAIRKHLEGVLAYVRERLTNGYVEGINNRLRMVARRAYGFHSHKALIAMAFLCCGGIQLQPRLPRPTGT